MSQYLQFSLSAVLALGSSQKAGPALKVSPASFNITKNVPPNRCQAEACAVASPDLPKKS